MSKEKHSIDKQIQTTLDILYAIKDNDKFYFMEYGKDSLMSLVKNCSTQNVSVSSFINSVANKAVYINGKHYSNELKKMSIPVIEYNELKQLAEDWDDSNSR